MSDRKKGFWFLRIIVLWVIVLSLIFITGSTARADSIFKCQLETGQVLAVEPADLWFFGAGDNPTWASFNVTLDNMPFDVFKLKLNPDNTLTIMSENGGNWIAVGDHMKECDWKDIGDGHILDHRSVGYSAFNAARKYFIENRS